MSSITKKVVQKLIFLVTIIVVQSKLQYFLSDYCLDYLLRLLFWVNFRVFTNFYMYIFISLVLPYKNWVIDALFSRELNI